METSPVIFLVVYCFIVLSTVISISFLIMIIMMIWRSEQREKWKFSLILKYYFWMLLIMSILLLIHTSTVLIIWRNDLKLPIMPFFWTGIFDSTFMTIIPFTTFMLTFDRCLILLLEAGYKQSWNSLLFYVSILINISIAGTNFVLHILFHHSELPEGCIATGCIITHYAQLTYTYSRTIGVIANSIIGIIFIAIVTWLNKKKPEIGSKVKVIAEAVILRAVIFGLIFDFIPHVMDSIFMSVTDIDPFSYIGPYSRVIMSVDLLLNSIMNWMVFKRVTSKIVVAQLTIINHSENTM